MRKSDLVAQVSERTDLAAKKASDVVDVIFEEITNALSRAEPVNITGFGAFSQRHRSARTGRSPKTGEPVSIDASNSVGFKPGKGLKDAVNS